MSSKFVTSLEHVLKHAKGENVGGRVTYVTPPHIDVASIRKKLGLSQVDFANHYGFSVSTLRSWEQGRREPEGPARILLQVIENEPKVVEKVVENLYEKSSRT